ncbi:hypothetical protein [Limosilactobacillus ingluviei]|uniref:hypothetical protein n=1 Tax=Limosilactobacillus ingluviei TaxID=148604 RepID=UPI0024B99AD7|nr:hypothetical protein [Limosilactobacillus ingluviei]
MAKKSKKKMLELEEQRLKNRRSLYMMISALAFPIGVVLDMIEWLLKHYLK